MNLPKFRVVGDDIWLNGTLVASIAPRLTFSEKDDLCHALDWPYFQTNAEDELEAELDDALNKVAQLEAEIAWQESEIKRLEEAIEKADSDNDALAGEVKWLLKRLPEPQI